MPRYPVSDHCDGVAILQPARRDRPFVARSRAVGAHAPAHGVARIGRAGSAAAAAGARGARHGRDHVHRPLDVSDPHRQRRRSSPTRCSPRMPVRSAAWARRASVRRRSGCVDLPRWTSSCSATTTTIICSHRPLRRSAPTVVTALGVGRHLPDKTSRGKVSELDWWSTARHARRARSRPCRRSTSRRGRRGTRTSRSGAASSSRSTASRSTSPATPATRRSLPRSARDSRTSTSRSCRSAPTSRAGSWSRCT